MRSTSSPLAVSMMIGTDSPARAQAAADGQAVLAGQHQVEDEEVRRIALQLAFDVARVRQRDHLEPLFAEVARQEVPQAGVVVDDQDAGRGGLAGHGRLNAARAGPVQAKL